MATQSPARTPQKGEAKVTDMLDEKGGPYLFGWVMRHIAERTGPATAEAVKDYLNNSPGRIFGDHMNIVHSFDNLSLLRSEEIMTLSLDLAKTLDRDTRGGTVRTLDSLGTLAGSIGHPYVANDSIKRVIGVLDLAARGEFNFSLPSFGRISPAPLAKEFELRFMNSGWDVDSLMSVVDYYEKRLLAVHQRK